MVDTMMQEQMSIGRQSILDMAKLVGANPDANVQTIVQMTKLGLPVTEEMAAQFENYLSDRQALVGEMDLAAGHMMELDVYKRQLHDRADGDGGVKRRKKCVKKKYLTPFSFYAILSRWQ